MGIISAILAAIPVIGQIISLFQKTPQEKWEAHTRALLQFIQDVQAGVTKAETTKGDTSAVENTLNKR